MKYHDSSFGDFRCGNCGHHVSTAHILSGVHNRNHCPYCLWSCHLDLYSAGDRLSACKARMRPIGLTMKRSRNKYQIKSQGELMLIHQCTDCGSLSINRIAADDDTDSIMDVFNESLMLSYQSRKKCEQEGIEILCVEDLSTVHIQLCGQHVRNIIPA